MQFFFFQNKKPDKPPPKKNDTLTIEAFSTELRAEGFVIDRNHVETLLTGAQRPCQSISPFYEGNHYADRWQFVTGIAKGKNTLNLRCSKPNHVSKNCPAKQSKCYKCMDGEHYKSIYDEEHSSREESKGNEIKVDDAEETLSSLLWRRKSGFFFR